MKRPTPRRDAREAGEPTYIPEHPCKKCGTRLRNTKSAHCLGAPCVEHARRSSEEARRKPNEHRKQIILRRQQREAKREEERKKKIAAKKAAAAKRLAARKKKKKISPKKRKEIAAARQRMRESDRKRNYLSNANFLDELEKSHEIDQMTDELGKMIVLLCDRFATKPNFSGYKAGGWLTEMKGAGILAAAAGWRNFDMEKSLNPFAYFTQVIKNAFLQELKRLQKQSLVRDLSLIKEGLEPSLNYKDNLKRFNVEL